MAQKDLAYGSRTIRRILRDLQHPEELADKYAEAILEQARRNAAGRPTPQARMAAANLDVQNGSIGPVAGGAPAEVAIGSEFGSGKYLQFQRSPNPAGYWLYPATRDLAVLAETDTFLQDIVTDAIRRPL